MAKTTPNPIDKHVGARVRMRRMMISVSQEKLGDALGITFQQIQKYEKGTNRISASRLQQIADVLQVPVSFFFDGAPGTSSSSADHAANAMINRFLTTTGGPTLASLFVRLDPKDRKTVLDLVASLVVGPERQGARRRVA